MTLRASTAKNVRREVANSDRGGTPRHAHRSPMPSPQVTLMPDHQPAATLLAAHDEVQAVPRDRKSGHAPYVGVARDELDVLDVDGGAAGEHERGGAGEH